MLKLLKSYSATQELELQMEIIISTGAINLLWKRT